jgi:hypothetical protein
LVSKLIILGILLEKNRFSTMINLPGAGISQGKNELSEITHGCSVRSSQELDFFGNLN